MHWSAQSGAAAAAASNALLPWLRPGALHLVLRACDTCTPHLGAASKGGPTLRAHQMRGRGSLQQLVGRSVFTRSQHVIPAAPPAHSEAAGAPPALPPPARDASPLRGGHVRCPVCQAQVEEAGVNAHIDKCLAQASSKRSKQQTTLLQYATPPAGGARAPRPAPQHEPSGAAASSSATTRSAREVQAPAAVAQPVSVTQPQPSSQQQVHSSPRRAAATTRHQNVQARLRHFPSCVVGRRFQQDARNLPAGMVSATVWPWRARARVRACVRARVRACVRACADMPA